MTLPVLLTPLGGLGEIGMNCLVLEQSSAAGVERLVVDCGVTFPSEDDGVELLHPRFDALLDAPGDLAAVVLTHGHEDHVGGLPYLVAALAPGRARPLPVVGPRYALELARERLEDAGVEERAYDLRAIAPGEKLRLGGFEVEPVRVTHSIVDATALILGTAAGRIVHTGDFKLEESPLDGERTDEARLARAGDEGVRLLLSDSTNVFQRGVAGGELPVEAALDRLVGQAAGRVVVALFASNVHRLRALGAIAHRHRRHVCLLGRSLRRHAELAQRLGMLDWPSDRLVSPEIAAGLPARRVLYLATGTQAEPRGALARLAGGDHHELKLGPGDLVVLSSRIIPGAERAVFAMQDALLRRGVTLVNRMTHPAIHVSGHAHRDEQARMLELVRPRAFVPVHGTLHHLVEHEALAKSLGVAETAILENGERLEVSAEGLVKLATVPCGRVAIAGGRVVDAVALRERRELGRSGVVLVTLRLDAERRVSDVRATAVGVSQRERSLAEALRAARGATTQHVGPAARLVDRVQRAVRGRLLDVTGQRPVVQVEIVAAGDER